MIPLGVSVTPFEQKLAALPDGDPGADWYVNARAILRGGDGGEHGLLIYKLVAERSNLGHPLVLLDIGTARGFSAIIMARAIIKTHVEGRVHTVDVVGHDEIRGWHADKHLPLDPLVDRSMSRLAIWSDGYQDEASRITPITGRSVEFLASWRNGPVDLAFLDGSHKYGDVKQELDLLESIVTPSGVIVLDDYHIGITALQVRSRALNALIRATGSVLRRLWPSSGERLRLATDTAFVVVKQRYSGIKRAILEFLQEQQGRWSLEIVSMPSRGEYQGNDYALALLTRVQKY